MLQQQRLGGARAIAKCKEFQKQYDNRSLQRPKKVRSNTSYRGHSNSFDDDSSLMMERQLASEVRPDNRLGPSIDYGNLTPTPPPPPVQAFSLAHHHLRQNPSVNEDPSNPSFRLLRLHRSNVQQSSGVQQEQVKDSSSQDRRRAQGSGGSFGGPYGHKGNRQRGRLALFNRRQMLLDGETGSSSNSTSSLDRA